MACLSLQTGLQIPASLFRFRMTSRPPLFQSEVDEIEQQAYNPDRNEHDASCHWRIIVAGNAAYEQDFLNWYGYCQRSGLCPTRKRRANLTPNRNGNSSDFGVGGTVDVILYAQDEKMYQLFIESKQLIVKRGWDIQSKFAKVRLTKGPDRFDYADTTGGYRLMMSQRPTILMQELESIPSEQMASTRLLFMDLDTVILKDPRPYFQGEFDFWGADSQCDWSGTYNAGMLAFRPSAATIQCIKDWRTDLENQTNPSTNRKPFNDVVRKMDNKIRHKLLPKDKFPVGKVLEGKSNIGPNSLEKDVVVFHNNYCEGDCFKPERFRKLGLWNPVRRQDTL